MNYQQIYNKIIENAKNREVYDKRFSIENYIEKHHILPKSFGGSDSHENLVNLTAREHYLCHALLMKIAKQNYSLNKSEKTLKEYRQMWYAFNMMNISISSSQKRYFNSKLFEVFKNKNIKITKKYEKNYLERVFIFYIEKNCVDDPIAFEALKAKFKFNGTKKQLVKLFNKNEFKIMDYVCDNNINYNRNPSINKNTLTIMFADYTQNNCSFNDENFKAFKEKHNYNGTRKKLVDMFNNYDLKTSVYNTCLYPKDVLKEMCDFYRDNNCSVNQEKFNELRNKYKYTNTKDTLISIFNRHGLKVSNIKQERKYNKEIVSNMFNFYIKNNCGTNKKNYELLQLEYEYNSDKKQLLKLFARNDLYVKKVNIK